MRTRCAEAAGTFAFRGELQASREGSFRWPPVMDGVMKLSPIEFAALFDGLDWTRVQTTQRIPTPTVAA
jgi:transposase